MSNKQLTELLDFHTNMIVDELLKLRKQQDELAARIAFVSPSEGDIRREVDAFVDSFNT